MTRYIINRILISIPLFFGITMIVYAMFALSPGDPIVNILGYDNYVRLTADEIMRVRQQYGLDQPIPVRYLRWLGDAVQGDLGYPLRGNMTVVQHLAERIPPTLLLMGTSLTLALLLGIPMGIIMALRQYSWADYALTIVAFANLSVPSFFIGLAFIYVFALKLDVLPTYGMQTIGVSFASPLDLVADRARHLIMPSVILGVFNAGTWARYTRASILEVMRLEYVTTARAKGLMERIVIARHVFRNALLPLITVISLSLPNLLGGAVITETIFQWPGMGMLGYRATTTRDYPLLMGVTLVSAIMILLSNLIADIAYAVADPRIHYD